jgi:hypothetical protein
MEPALLRWRYANPGKEPSAAILQGGTEMPIKGSRYNADLRLWELHIRAPRVISDLVVLDSGAVIGFRYEPEDAPAVRPKYLDGDDDA